jgi:hypothetical protein
VKRIVRFLISLFCVHYDAFYANQPITSRDETAFAKTSTRASRETWRCVYCGRTRSSVIGRTDCNAE